MTLTIPRGSVIFNRATQVAAVLRQTITVYAEDIGDGWVVFYYNEEEWEYLLPE